MSKVHSRTYDFGPRFSELVLHEIDPRYSREEVTLAASSGDLEFGTVLTRNADGNYAALKEADGTLGDAKAVLVKKDEAVQALHDLGFAIKAIEEVQDEA